MTIPQEAIDLILDAEGIDQPGKWPGEESGVTLGYGCDIGADPGSLEFWRGVLTDTELERLEAAKGLTGPRAAHIASRFSDIHVTKEQALEVFMGKTIPREIAKTVAAFPNSDQLPPAALGALVSLVYNRGTALGGDRRKEMANIHSALVNWTIGDEGKNEVLGYIADQLESMKRLWEGQGVDGLLKRRDAEAELVRSAIG